VQDSVAHTIDTLMPEVGVGLLVGQWGVYKTFIACYMAACIITGTKFITFDVERRGGVLFLAAEKPEEVPVRSRAALQELGIKHDERVPFVFDPRPPMLLAPGALDELRRLAAAAQTRMQERFGVDLVLIIIETWVDGQDNDTATTERIKRVAAELSHAAECFVLVLDHFGKVKETGTKGSANKEAGVPLVLAVLGERTETGKIVNQRLALRKRPSGEAGIEFPFKVRVKDMGVNARGKPVDTLVIDWGKGEGSISERASKDSAGWAKASAAEKMLRRVLLNIGADQGCDLRPFPDGPMVRAVDAQIARAEFIKSYPAEGVTPEQRKDAARKAWARAQRFTQAKNLIGIRELEGKVWIWLADAQAAPQSKPQHARD
jgi:hypothetical protein